MDIGPMYHPSIPSIPPLRLHNHLDPLIYASIPHSCPVPFSIPSFPHNIVQLLYLFSFGRLYSLSPFSLLLLPAPKPSLSSCSSYDTLPKIPTVTLLSLSITPSINVLSVILYSPQHPYSPLPLLMHASHQPKPYSLTSFSKPGYGE